MAAGRAQARWCGRAARAALVLACAAAPRGALALEPADCRGSQQRVHVHVGVEGKALVVGGGRRRRTPAPGEGTEQRRREEQPCRIAWLPHEEIAQPGVAEAALGLFDHVLTNSFEHVRFGERQGRLHFLESVGEIFLPPDADTVLMGKEHMLSVLLPMDESPAWDDPLTHEIRRQALKNIPDHTFVDDGSLELHVRAFGPYRFSLIADDENHTISQAFIRCIGLQAVPLFNGFAQLGVMTLRAIVPYNRTHFGLEPLRATMSDINHDIGWLWNYHRMLQDQLLYRYAQPFQARLLTAACTLCRLQRGLPLAPPGGAEAAASQGDTVPARRGPTSAPLASVAVFSAGANLERRLAIRETWARVLREAYNIRVRFFLGSLDTLGGANGSQTSNLIDQAQILHEIETYDDLVLLDVPEGYKMNSRKGLLLLEWCAQHLAAEFLLKVDDDVYLRPAPVLAVLSRRTPFGYIWGYFDYLSPVPREDDDPFSSDEETFPFPAFPPYPRGVVRALSMDIVRRVAAASRQGRLRMVAGDDPCLGVHLRQLVFDEEDPLPLLEMDDRDSYRAFAMEPSCSESLWSNVSPRTWAAHHVTAEQLRCMWAADVRAGYYSLEGGAVSLSSDAAAAAEAAANVATAPAGTAPEVPPLPDVCDCLLTGPLAAALANRSDKINASRTYQIWGDPNAELE